MAYKDPERAKAYNRAWAAAHPERVKAMKDRSREKHRDQRRAYDEAYRKAHPEKAQARSTKYRQRHRASVNASLAAYRATHTAAKRRHTLGNYGLSEVEYAAMLGDQGGVCAACGSPEEWPLPRKPGTVRPLSVDHDHETGKVRGLLCARCNIAIGFHGATELRRLAAYAERHGILTRPARQLGETGASDQLGIFGAAS